jgi:hypothetical protein
LRIGRDVEIQGAEFIIDRVRALVARCPPRRQLVRKPFTAPLPVEPIRPNRTLPPVGAYRRDEAGGIGWRGPRRDDGESEYARNESSGACDACVRCATPPWCWMGPTQTGT